MKDDIYKTTITFESDRPKLVLHTIIDGLYSDESILDYKWIDWFLNSSNKHKLEMTIKSKHGLPSLWIDCVVEDGELDIATDLWINSVIKENG